VNRHENLEETCSIIARSISFSLYRWRNDHPITSSDLRTYDRIELCSDCWSPLFPGCMAMGRSIDGRMDGILADPNSLLFADSDSS
jgi:hypothetical protein